MRPLLNTFFLAVVFLLGVLIGNFEILKDDKIHLIISPLSELENEWTVDFCGKSFEIKESFYISNFDCEGNVVIKKNNKIIDKIYITGGYDYYISVDSFNDENTTNVKVI